MAEEIRIPRDIAEEIVKLSDHYSKLGERLNEIRKLYAIWWQSCRIDYKSDMGAEKAWDLTNEGQEMMEISLKMKTTDRKSSALKNYLRVMENEVRGQW
jgi:hypothetical protein